MNNGMLGASYPQLDSQYKSVWNPDLPPSNPHPYNDEFDDGQFSGWGIAGSDSGYLWEYPDRSLIRLANIAIYKPVTPGNDFTMWTRLSITGRPDLSNYSWGGIFVQVGTGTIWTLGITVGTNTYMIEQIKWKNWLTWDTTPKAIGGQTVNHMYLRVHRSGNTITMSFSRDGIAYGRINVADLANVDRVGIWTWGNNTYGYFNFFRFANGVVPIYELLPGNNQRIFY